MYDPALSQFRKTRHTWWRKPGGLPVSGAYVTVYDELPPMLLPITVRRRSGKAFMLLFFNVVASPSSRSSALAHWAA